MIYTAYNRLQIKWFLNINWYPQTFVWRFPATNISAGVNSTASTASDIFSRAPSSGARDEYQLMRNQLIRWEIGWVYLNKQAKIYFSICIYNENSWYNLQNIFSETITMYVLHLNLKKNNPCDEKYYKTVREGLVIIQFYR